MDPIRDDKGQRVQPARRLAGEEAGFRGNGTRLGDLPGVQP